ncbi:hypothetical protein ACLF3G_01395 [Falsiroseomonas sp. HC035]|uniref:hypothetical protein n=1 Tax=Falsiroseomonas sp. HC035 TaxID=3390999 RepID=UPI003D31096F
MAWLALGALVLVALIGLGKLFAEASPAQVKRAIAWFAGGLGAVLVVALLASGRAGQAFWALALFGPAAWRIIQARRAAGTFARGGAASAGQASDVETAHLAMGLDHDSGRMTGHVKAGSYAGADLADLDLPDLLALMAELASLDPEGATLLEAWLDRSHPDWRHQAPPPPPGGPMSRAEALAVLGLAEGASLDEIRAAHRRLMRSAHPDQGGSDWLASRLNEARDVLIP